jgi:hypothetical protein
MRLIFGLRMGIILLVLGAMLATACSLSKLKGGSRSSSKGTGGSNAFSPSSDARKDLGDALRKLNSAYPYRLTETMSATANGQIAMPESTRVIEFAASDRSHVKWTGGSGGDFEQITIGEKRYSLADGKWSEQLVPAMAQRVKRGEEFARKLGEMIKEVKYLGPETIKGVPCYAYAYTIETTLSGQSYVGSGKAWIDADGLPRQNDLEFKVAGYASKSHIVYEYNVDVKVERPIP